MPLVVFLLSNAINNAAITVGKINTWNTNSRVIVLRINNKHNTTNLMDPNYIIIEETVTGFL